MTKIAGRDAGSPHEVRSYIALAMLFLVVTLTGSSRDASAAPGDVDWHDEFNGGFNTEANRVVFHRGVFVIAGTLIPTEGLRPIGVVRAYDQKSGRLLWQDIDLSVTGYAFEIAAGEGRVFAVGVTVVPPALTTIRAYDIHKGSVLWHVASPRAAAIAVGGGRVFVVGDRVRAYSAETGGLLWQSPAVTGGVTGVRTYSGRVYVTLVASSTNGAIQSYDASSGKLLWSCATGPVTALAVAGHVFTAEYGVNEFAVRAYNAISGRVLWERRTPGRFAYLSSISVSGGRVFVAGSIQSSDFESLFVRSYLASTGIELWSDEFDLGYSAFARGITFADGTLIVVGEAIRFEPPTFPMFFVVRAYRATSGRIVWADDFDRGGHDNLADGVATDGRRVVAVGRGMNADGIFEFIVRAYELK